MNIFHSFPRIRFSWDLFRDISNPFLFLKEEVELFNLIMKRAQLINRFPKLLLTTIFHFCFKCLHNFVGVCIVCRCYVACFLLPLSSFPGAKQKHEMCLFLLPPLPLHKSAWCLLTMSFDSVKQGWR